MCLLIIYNKDIKEIYEKEIYFNNYLNNNYIFYSSIIYLFIKNNINK